MPIPWHLQREPFRERSRIPELLLEQGRVNAESIRRSGDIWANAITGAAGTVGEAIRRGPEEKEALEVSRARRAALEEETAARKQGRETQQQRNAAIASGQTRQRILQSLANDPEGTQQALKHFQAIDDNMKRTLGEYAAGVRRTGDNPAYAEAALQDMVENGWDAKQLEPYRSRMMTKEGVTSLVDTLLRGSPDDAHKALATKQEEAYTLAPGAKRLKGGQVIAENPAAAKEPNRSGEEQFIFSKFGPNPTPEQLLQGRAAFAAAAREPDKPPQPIPRDVYNKDTGEMETTYIMPADAAAIARGEKPPLSKGPGTAERNRMGAARTSIERGESLLSELQDPKFADKIGAVIGRYNSLAAAAGAGDPDAQYIVGEIKSFAALQPQIHGFRAVEMAKDVERLLSTKQDPKALSAALKGILTASYSVAKKPQGAGASVRKIKDAAEYNALPSGTEYVDPDGVRRRKP